MDFQSIKLVNFKNIADENLKLTDSPFWIIRGKNSAGKSTFVCDALTYGQRFEPAALIDVATLTGAAVVALGHHASAIMSKHDDLAE